MSELDFQGQRPNPWFLESATDLETKFLMGRRHRGADYLRWLHLLSTQHLKLLRICHLQRYVA